MTKELLSEILADMYDHAIPRMDAEQPKKMMGEAERIYHFGYESFQVGFLYGMGAGFGTREEMEKDKTDGEETT